MTLVVQTRLAFGLVMLSSLKPDHRPVVQRLCVLVVILLWFADSEKLGLLSFTDIFKLRTIVSLPDNAGLGEKCKVDTLW